MLAGWVVQLAMYIVYVQLIHEKDEEEENDNKKLCAHTHTFCVRLHFSFTVYYVCWVVVAFHVHASLKSIFGNHIH